MRVRGTYVIQFSGPANRRDAAISALTDAGIAAEPDQSVDPDDPTAEGLGWVVAMAHDGSDNPSPEFESDIMRRATDAVTPYGYRVRSQGTVIAGPADMREVVHRPTDRIIARMNSTSMDASALANIAATFGVDVEELYLREVPGTWDLT